MQLDLPKPVAAYFTADRGDSEATSQCFTETAVVTDEGHPYRGRAAIKQWKAEASTSPEEVAARIIEGIRNNQEEVLADQMSHEIKASLASNPQMLYQQLQADWDNAQ